jgi:hypothetical protein
VGGQIREESKNSRRRGTYTVMNSTLSRESKMDWP